MQNSGFSDFIQLIIRAKGKVPSIILYTENQISDIIRFCCGGPSAISTVISVDNTFNLSHLHVTVTGFKNLSVNEKASREHPVMFGPFFYTGTLTLIVSFYFLIVYVAP